MDNKVEISREIAEWAQNKMSWDSSPKIRDMGKGLRKLLDEAPVVKHQEPIGYYAGGSLGAIRERHEQYGQAEFRAQTVKYGEFSSPLYAESPEMAELVELRAELARIRSVNHNQILAEAAARHLVNSNSKNYVGEVFTIALDDGSAKFEVVVTTQKVDGQSPHDFLQASEKRNAELVELLREAYKYPLEHACSTGSWPAQELCERIDTVIKPTESDAGAGAPSLGSEKAVEDQQISFGVDRLNLMDPSTVGDMLRGEHPKVIATILACLDKVHMANILELLDEKTRNDQLMRIFKLNGTNPLDGKGQESK
ncbi:hypothetical protein V0M98_34075 (plasmid) [Pseudomonas silesiensis]|uniref:hypothetical protein n=1 Tax=Pseudomonas silesiensis TaxID=1853130 RepID=UPI0030D42E67